MIDMLDYLQHPKSAAGETRLAADYSCETGHAWSYIAVTAASFSGSLAATVASWLSLRPRIDTDSVPGVRLEKNGASLVIPAEIDEEASRHLIEVFLRVHRQRADGQKPTAER